MTLALVAGTVAGASALVQRWQAAHRIVLRDLGAETARLNAVARSLPRIEEQVTALQAHIADAGIVIEAASLQQGVAALQAQVDEIVTAGGGAITRLTSDDALRADMVTLTAEYRAEATAAIEILSMLETGRPMLFTQSVTLSASRAPGDGGATMLQVTARFDAYVRSVQP